MQKPKQPRGSEFDCPPPSSPIAPSASDTPASGSQAQTEACNAPQPKPKPKPTPTQKTCSQPQYPSPLWLADPNTLHRAEHTPSLPPSALFPSTMAHPPAQAQRAPACFYPAQARPGSKLATEAEKSRGGAGGSTDEGLQGVATGPGTRALLTTVELGAACLPHQRGERGTKRGGVSGLPEVRLAAPRWCSWTECGLGNGVGGRWCKCVGLGREGFYI